MCVRAARTEKSVVTESIPDVMTRDTEKVVTSNVNTGGPAGPRGTASIATLGFIRRLIIAFGLMVFIPLLVMVYIHLSGQEVSFFLVLISTSLASVLGFYVVWDMVTRVVSLLQDLRRVNTQEAPDAAGVEQSVSQLIRRMQENMAELGTKARLLDESERRLGDATMYSSQILSSIADFVIVTNQQFQVTKVNSAIQTALGYEADELSGRPIETVLRGMDGGDALLGQDEIAQLTKVGALWGKSGMLRSRDGEGIPVQTNLSVVKDGSGLLNGIVIVARDVRETLRLVADLQQAKTTLEDRVRQRTVEIEHALFERGKALSELTGKDDQLIRQEKMASLGQLAAGVAHEINNPVGFVNSNLQMLQTYLRDLTRYVEQASALTAELLRGASRESLIGQIQDLVRWGEQAQLTQTVEDAKQSVVESIEGLNRVKKIVSALREFSHADQDDPAWADLNEGLESTINIVWNELKYKTALHRDYGDLPKVLCYPHQLNQVFMNLLVNAAQAIPERGDIWVKTWAEGDSVYVDVRDTGTGIPEEQRSKIFDPFFTTKPVGQGTGLGLSIVYGIVERHGGTVRVESRLGEGTTFHLSFPIERVVQAAA
jgi:PAS domain S-box-containing protein